MFTLWFNRFLWALFCALVILSLIACGAPATATVISNPPVQAQPACVPLENHACVVVAPKTISGGQVASTYMAARWIPDNENVGSPAMITVKFGFRGIENRQVEVQPNGQTQLDGGTFANDVTVYEIEATGYTCSWREGTNIIDCSQ